MNLPKPNNKHYSPYSTYRCYRNLANEFRNKPKKIINLSDAGGIITIPAKTDGVDIETCSFTDLKNILLKPHHKFDGQKGIRKKSESQKGFVFDIMAWRYPTEFTDFQRASNFPTELKKEAELTQSNLQKEFEHIGKRGFSGTIRQDGSLNNPKTKQIKNNDMIKIRRI